MQRKVSRSLKAGLCLFCLNMHHTELKVILHSRVEQNPPFASCQDKSPPRTPSSLSLNTHAHLGVVLTHTSAHTQPTDVTASQQWHSSALSNEIHYSSASTLRFCEWKQLIPTEGKGAYTSKHLNNYNGLLIKTY